jgi:hypothetical protein
MRRVSVPSAARGVQTFAQGGDQTTLLIDCAPCASCRPVSEMINAALALFG